MNPNVIKNCIAFVQETLKNAEGGHDWFHIERVYKNALAIQKEEKADELTIQLGALLHDIADSKFHDGNESIGPDLASRFLINQNVPDDITQHVISIIKNISFKGGNFSPAFRSLELDIIQDADRLDAIGAVGIARCFSYGGFKQRAIFDPDMTPNLHMSKEEYKTSTAPSLNHFYEKLLRLKDLMNTQTGKKIAQERHEFMEQFLEQFFKEAGPYHSIKSN